LAERYSSCVYNKGMIMQPEEIQYLSGDVWMAEKLDGEMVKIVHSAGSLTVVQGSPARVFKCVGYTSPCKQDFVLQAEMMTVEGKQWIVATDVLVAPWGTHGTFISRWRWLEGVVKRNLGKWPFSLQKWYDIKDPRCLDVMARAVEGIVLQQLAAISGQLKEGRGSSMYVKRIKTIDVRMSNRIAEVKLGSNEFVRWREDKIKPNPPHVIRTIANGVDYDDFSIFMRMRYSASCQTTMDRMVYLLTTKIPMPEWTYVDKINMFQQQYDPMLELLEPVYLRTIRVQLADHFRRQDAKYTYDSTEVVEAIYDDGVTEYNSGCVVDVQETTGEPLENMVMDSIVLYDDLVKWKVPQSSNFNKYKLLLLKSREYEAAIKEWYVENRKEKIAAAKLQGAIVY